MTIYTVIVFLFVVQIITPLQSGPQISQKCHCDITTSFCDFGCCCDTDCSSTISESCFYSKSSYYCPTTDFFKSIKPGSATGGMCYYYNASITTIAEQSLTNTQRSRIVSENAQVSSAAVMVWLSQSTVSSGYKGYKMGSILTIGRKSTFSFIDNTGNCINSTGSTSTFSLRFGMNARISCKCSSCGTPLLYSDILDKTIPQYLDLTSNDLKLPSITSTSISTLKINFIIGMYGSQNVKYIDRITYSYESIAGSATKTLYLNFIDSDNIKQIDNSASFFPQIPSDMFYPIHVMS